MFKRNSLRKYFTLILMFFTVVIGFSSWIIVGEKSVNLGKVPSNRAVAYIEYDCFSASTYTASGSYSSNYTSIEAALRFAESGDCVHVILNTSDPAVIRYDCEIKSGVLLNISYQDKVVQSENTNGVVVSTSQVTDITSAVEKQIVKIDKDVTLINNGTLIISGVLSGGGGECNYLGHTSGDYASIIMGENSKIYNYGIIRCCGYIKEETDNNGSIIINNIGSKLSLPFIIRDFRGGSATYSIAKSGKEICPFNLFEIRNIQCRNIFMYSSNLVGYANIFVKDHNSSSVYLIGTNNDANTNFFNLYENSYMEIKYDKNKQKMKFDIYGGAEIKSISISVEIDLKLTTYQLNISTKDFYFPISYKMEIYLKKLPSQSSATYNTSIQKIKIMPGGKLVVESGVTFNSSSINVYSYFSDSGPVPGTDYDLFRDTGEIMNHNPGYFEVNGFYNCNGDFGGKILYSNNENNISISGKKTLTTYEAHSTDTLTMSDLFWINEKYNPVSLSSIKNKNEIIVYLLYQNDYSVPTYTILNTSYSTNMVIYSSDATIKLSYDSNTSSAKFNDSNYENNQVVTLGEYNKFLLNGTAPSSGGGGGGCLLPGTLVTMADGTKKPVEKVQPGDMLKVFNHYTGEYDVSPVVFNDYEPKQDVNVINLEFSNGSNIGVVYEHGFFDLDLMKYVYINEYNYNDYVGHRFYSDGNNIVTLNRVYITTQYTEVYSPVTAYHLNYFTEDILSMPGGIEGLFNIFEYDDDLKYNEELMKQDIEKYGLYTYDDFKDYCSYEFYQAFPAEYLKVAVGKGYITFDEIIYLINRYKTKV